jgi:hypothetical protein
MGSPWVVGVLVAVGTTGLLLPLLLAPVTSDSRYHYLAAPERFDDSLLGVLPWTIDDIQGRLEAGRFAPLGVFVQHVLYYLGMKLALFTGMEVYLAVAVIKTGLLAVVVLCFRALLRRLRDSGGLGLARHERDVGLSVPGRLPEAGLVGQIALRAAAAPDRSPRQRRPRCDGRPAVGRPRPDDGCSELAEARQPPFVWSPRRSRRCDSGADRRRTTARSPFPVGRQGRCVPRGHETPGRTSPPRVLPALSSVRRPSRASRQCGRSARPPEEYSTGPATSWYVARSTQGSGERGPGRPDRSA